ncbi:hypothetical protein ABW45_08515 [Stenotrophomonas maltophilia]|nr:hypothetical protein ABW45_08515 [Stenotrophomonas maltophilia]
MVDEQLARECRSSLGITTLELGTQFGGTHGSKPATGEIGVHGVRVQLWAEQPFHSIVANQHYRQPCCNAFQRHSAHASDTGVSLHQGGSICRRAKQPDESALDQVGKCLLHPGDGHAIATDINTRQSNFRGRPREVNDALCLGRIQS